MNDARKVIATALTEDLNDMMGDEPMLRFYKVADEVIAALHVAGFKIMPRNLRTMPYGAHPVWSVSMEQAYKDLWDAAP